MKEVYDFRLAEDESVKHLASSEGTTLGGSVRRISTSAGSPLYEKILEIDRKMNHMFVLSWSVQRNYTTNELNSAEAFLLKSKKVMEPCGEACGTLYDDNSSCQYCGSGSMQLTELLIDQSKLTKFVNLAFVQTIAEELLFSLRFIEELDALNVTGTKFGLIRSFRNSDHIIRMWKQLIGTSHMVDIVQPTKAGIKPGDDDIAGKYRCPYGHTIGLNLLSELFVSRRQFYDFGCDIYFTRQFVGLRNGLLRPEKLLVVSPRVLEALSTSELKGWTVEIAHLV